MLVVSVCEAFTIARALLLWGRFPQPVNAPSPASQSISQFHSTTNALDDSNIQKSLSPLSSLHLRLYISSLLLTRRRLARERLGRTGSHLLTRLVERAQHAIALVRLAFVIPLSSPQNHPTRDQYPLELSVSLWSDGRGEGAGKTGSAHAPPRNDVGLFRTRPV